MAMTRPGGEQGDKRDWRRDETKPGDARTQLGADGDSDDVADSPTKGHGGAPSPAKGDSDDVADDPARRAPRP
jgi:hypothetical protein